MIHLEFTCEGRGEGGGGRREGGDRGKVGDRRLDKTAASSVDANSNIHCMQVNEGYRASRPYTCCPTVR